MHLAFVQKQLQALAHFGAHGQGSHDAQRVPVKITDQQKSAAQVFIAVQHTADGLQVPARSADQQVFGPDAGNDPLSIARQQGLSLIFSTVHLRGAHPNTVQLTLEGDQGARLEMEAASVGGGNIDITSLGGMNVDFSGKENTLIIRHRDTPGMIALVSGVLAGRQMNIATMQVFRRDAGAEAIMVLELDTPLTPDLLAELRGLHDVMDATFLARRDD